MLSAANAAIKASLAKEPPFESFQKQLAADYKQRMLALSKLQSHIISIKTDPESQDSWVEREFQYHKITIQDYNKATELIEEYEGYDFALTEEGAEARMHDMLAAYCFMATCFLKMSESEFYSADWEGVKDVINACLYRTENTIAADNKNLTELFFFGNTKTITKQESDYIKMFRLWKNWQTKPWEVNGDGNIYPEDINTILRIEDILNAAEKHEREKAQARAKMQQKKKR